MTHTNVLPQSEVEPLLETVEFLSRSANRVRVLDALTAGPADRRGIEAATGVSRATLSRTLAAFERRGWVDRDRDRYELTELGAFVAREFRGLLDRLRVVDDLREVVRWFPEEEYGFDLAGLAGADVVRSRKADAFAPTTHLVESLESAERARIASYTLLPDCIETCRRRVAAGRLTLDLILGNRAVAAVEAHPTTAAHIDELAASPAARLSRYDGDLPFVVVVADDAVNLCLSDEDGALHATIETTDPGIHAWATTRLDVYRREAVPIDAPSP
ncbi:helix-turn-helix transcriptional regulator [Salinilacihabitans rarus]|uniref:helix-turn-helix transcriptional regulator n=1 Tax=Salinilacihabitans rarus TaxID=2961596 RepID=UPI0020C85E28|nr:MarR family transcriptional regulator [Salinilacihabitans rarus]